MSDPTAPPGKPVVQLPDGTYMEFDYAGPVPTQADYSRARQQLELNLSRKAAPTPQAAAQPGGGIASQPAGMSARSERDVLESSIAENDAALKAANIARANTIADRYSAGGAIAGGLAGGAAGAKLGAASGHPGAMAAAGAVGTVVGSAIGAFGGQLGGYHAYGSPENALTPQQELDNAFESAAVDLGMNVGFGAAGMAARGLKFGGNATINALAGKFAGLGSPEVIQRVKNAREFGIRVAPADLFPTFSKYYASIFGGIPSVSGPLHTWKAERLALISSAVRSTTGPLESGMNEVLMGKNFVKAATNAYSVRKDWYDRIFKAQTNYFNQNPHIRFNNDARDVAQKYIYEQARSARPVVSRTTAKGTTETTTTTTAKRLSEGKVESLTEREALLSRDARTDWQTRLDINGNPITTRVDQLPSATLTDTTQGVKQKAISEATGETVSDVTRTFERTTTDHWTTTGFDNSGKVDQLIHETMNSPEVLSFHQYRGLVRDINAALDSKQATAEQATTLLQMKEHLDVAAENLGDDTGRALIRRGRKTYRQVMEFFENPTSNTLTKIDPNFARSVKKLTRGEVPSAHESELFGMLFDDLSPEGVKNISKMVGPENMKHATNRWVADMFENRLKLKTEGETKVDWDGLARDFGLHSPTSSQFASTQAMLKNGQYPMDTDKLARFIHVLSTEIGPTIPDVAKMYMRGAALSGPSAGLRQIMGTKALNMTRVGGGVVGGWVGPIATVIGLRKISRFLADPTRLEFLNQSTTLMKRPGGAAIVSRQLVRWLAMDIVADRHDGKTPSAEVALEETRLNGVVSEVEKAMQSRQPAQFGDPMLAPMGLPR